jgi:hypothetical protein
MICSRFSRVITLADDLDALIGKAVVVRRNQLGRNLLRLHQDGAGRLKDRRHRQGDPDRHRQDDDHAQPQQQGPVLDDGEVIFDGHLVFSLHGGPTLKVKGLGVCRSGSIQ